MPLVNPRSDDLVAYLKKLEDRIRRLEIAPSASFASSLNFDGDSATGDPGSTGWALTPDKAIFGQLIVRNGIIGDDALANPIAATVFSANSGAGQNGSSTFVSLATATVTVPSGFTRALVSASASAGASAVGGGGSYITVKPNISGSEPTSLTTWIVAGAAASLTVPHAALLSGLPSGGTFTVECFALETTPANIVAASVGGSIAGSVIFLR